MSRVASRMYSTGTVRTVPATREEKFLQSAMRRHFTEHIRPRRLALLFFLIWCIPLMFTSKVMCEAMSVQQQRSFRAFGKVQRVMFRQTIVQAIIKNGLQGGASNRKDDRNAVDFTLVGDSDVIDNLVHRLGSGKEINDWGARVDKLVSIDDEIGKDFDWRSHKVTTDNVHTFNWNPNVKMYL